MGCCQSRDISSHESPRPTQSPSDPALPRDSSRAPINQPNRSLSNVSSSRVPHPVNSRPNMGIRPATPIAKSPSKVSNQPPPWTRKHLEQERNAFFDTRVSGNDEVWKALRVVCEMVRNGDIAEAQGIMDAMNITCPTGRIARDRGKHKDKGGVFDERGALYDIPAWVVTDPQDIIEDKEKENVDGAADEDDEDDTVGATSRRKDEKGKGRAEDLGESVSLRARLSSTGTDVVVTAGTKEKVANIALRIQQRIGNKRVRLMYLGKTLDEKSTLEETSWKQGHVVNAMVFEGDDKLEKTISSTQKTLAK